MRTFSFVLKQKKKVPKRKIQGSRLRRYSDIAWRGRRGTRYARTAAPPALQTTPPLYAPAPRPIFTSNLKFKVVFGADWRDEGGKYSAPTCWQRDAPCLQIVKYLDKQEAKNIQPGECYIQSYHETHSVVSWNTFRIRMNVGYPNCLFTMSYKTVFSRSQPIFQFQ